MGNEVGLIYKMGRKGEHVMDKFPSPMGNEVGLMPKIWRDGDPPRLFPSPMGNEVGLIRIYK